MFDRSQLAFEQISYRMPHTLVTALSPRCADDVAEHYGVRRESIIVIPPGIDPTEFFPVLDDERVAARRQLDIGSSDFAVGIAANYAFRNKGVAELIRACGRCAVTLVVAGIADRRLDYYQDLAAEEGADVRFLGAVAEMRDFYAALDLFALPSTYEAYGMAAHEAMGCGIATVVSNVSGIAGLGAEQSALLTVRPHDVDELVSVIEALRDDGSRHELAGRGLEWAHARTWSQVGEDVSQALEHYSGMRGGQFDGFSGP
jgi:UDP-glucose:(heptosyl)LPS alpha-1,3-glucosyltransferase